jgi:hypothetical protein
MVILKLANFRYAYVLMSVASFSSLMALELVLSHISTRPQYYRPFEVYALPQEKRFKANIDIEFDMPFGDLFALSDFSVRALREPRTVRFVTDNLGYRNSKDYQNEKYIFFGDSFVAGTSGSQEFVLSELLKSKHGISAYNASLSGTPPVYLQIHNKIKRILGPNFRSVFVFFEGNDFQYLELSNKDTLWTHTPSNVRRLEVFRIFFGATRRLIFNSFQNSDGQVSIFKIGGLPVGFYNAYKKSIESGKAGLWTAPLKKGFEGICDEIALLVFVPCKYRVYYEHVPNSDNKQPLNTAFNEFLGEFASQINVPYLDLTPIFVMEGRKQLKNGQLLYWRDDTHWNPLGATIAAKAISEHLEKGN